MDETNTKELNLDTKVTVKSLAGWDTGFERRVDGMGDVNIAPEGTTRLSRNEIIAQVQTGNKLFSGIDGLGNHATLYINDKATRVELGFESEDGKTKQEFLDEDKVKKLFDIKTYDRFETAFMDAVQTRAEKYAVMQMIKKLKLNDYSKIRFAETYTGFKM